MANYKKRIDRITAQIGAADDGPRTVADIVYWIVTREEANGGQLTPADQNRAGYYWRRLFDEAAAAGR